MVSKRLLCSHRVRRIPRQFSWIDHGLVRDKYICGVSHSALALYLFLVTVGDAQGLSYYSTGAITRYLGFDAYGLSQARLELCQKGLVAFSEPLYQVLSLCQSGKERREQVAGIAGHEEQKRSRSEPNSVGEILRLLAGGVQ